MRDLWKVLKNAEQCIFYFTKSQPIYRTAGAVAAAELPVKYFYSCRANIFIIIFVTEPSPNPREGSQCPSPNIWNSTRDSNSQLRLSTRVFCRISLDVVQIPPTTDTEHYRCDLILWERLKLPALKNETNEETLTSGWVQFYTSKLPDENYLNVCWQHKEK